jgi:hypothetical protein
LRGRHHVWGTPPYCAAGEMRDVFVPAGHRFGDWAAATLSRENPNKMRLAMPPDRYENDSHLAHFSLVHFSTMWSASPDNTAPARGKISPELVGISSPIAGPTRPECHRRACAGGHRQDDCPWLWRLRRPIEP